MIRKLSAALAAMALVAAGPASAQASARAAPPTVAPAAEAGLGSQGESAIAGRQGARIYVLGAIIAGLAIWGILGLLKKKDDEDPISP